MKTVDHKMSRQPDEPEVKWLTSRALFDAYRRELPVHGVCVSDGLYCYDRKPEGISWSVWAWVGDNQLIVGYPPITLDPRFAGGLEFDAESFMRCCAHYIADLQEGLGLGLGSTKSIDPSDMNTSSSQFGARLANDGSVEVVWGCTGDWCGAALLKWWSIEYEWEMT